VPLSSELNLVEIPLKSFKLNVLSSKDEQGFLMLPKAKGSKAHGSDSKQIRTFSPDPDRNLKNYSDPEQKESDFKYKKKLEN